ncbi:SMP-30/gluconolactonase/LRE family protein [Paralcaligenes sp. KSB-10]|uniref:IclR family transcriptional regulator domain-containing protein n=1 Tax=Paralcaligenes sp. KSB-10 TaxID=2901142 RepID=UPI001E42C63B|nr:IclR family transcriptional regulator C-terminal domain-containing protein [Paralcaligenes sp. KSB-10]UHL64430.1 SMP-30/gluconolactonase/LRE family protein [Paralcaligenes sp. KSB-10]
MKSAEGTGALEKALDVLDAIGSTPAGLSQSELSARLDVPRATLYRLLSTLVARGMVRRDPLRRVYCLGLRCFEMARQTYAMPDLVAAALSEMRLLRDLTGETVYLATMEGGEAVLLERVEGVHARRSSTALGERKPLHCTSQGKAILSALDEGTRESIVKDLYLKSITPFTITDRRRLNAEIRLTAARGYAIDDEEIVPGVRCVGAPIRDAQGEVKGAISLAGPAYRLTRERLDLLGPELIQTAHRIGMQLGVRSTVDRNHDVVPVEGSWAFHGAHPVWSESRQCLYWADTLAASVRVMKNGRDSQLLKLDSPVTSMALSGCNILVTHQTGQLMISPTGKVSTNFPFFVKDIVASCEAEETEMWVAIRVAESEWQVGCVGKYGYFQRSWSFREPIACLRWNRQQACFYATAPESGAVYILSPGSPVVRRLISVPSGSGSLSGLAIEQSGDIWLALKDGWSVVRISADGTIDKVVGLSVPCPTDLAFGGADGKTLFVTTSRQWVPMDIVLSAPLSGKLLSINTH